MKIGGLKSKDGYYFFEDFLEYGCLAAFSGLRFNLGFNSNPELENNRKVFLEKLSINHRDLVCLKQVHNNKIFLASKKDKGRGALDGCDAIVGFDGIITQDKGLPLAVFTADCLSVFLYDRTKKIIAIVHAGWRGTKENIVTGALKQMKDVFSSNMRDVICGFGPSIRSCCYEVGGEFRNYFSRGLVRRKGSFFLDLISLSSSQLTSVGIPRENIIDSALCTSCRNEDFFSYRKEGERCGRMMSVIMIK